MFVETHCHIHESDYPLDIVETLQHAHDHGVDQLICVGTSIDSSRRAIEFSQQHDEAFATIGVHPHDTKDGWKELSEVIKTGKVVAIGETGLDYYYNHSPKQTQIEALEWQIDLALKNSLPIIFHVRDAFDDFWPIFNNFTGLKGVLHSFTDNQINLDEGLKRGLYIGVNGISTFTKDEVQKELFASIPLNRLLLETDAPFLTPVPFRGKVNEPAYIKSIATTQAERRGIPLDDLARATTTNARTLFSL
jgi:TatD DNase family protein